MSETTSWYIVKTSAGHCDIVADTNMAKQATEKQWGPFNTQGEAIAKRVGLIRAGQCKPV